MSQQLRSRQACWTCRLRKKKCDETKPTCVACGSLNITCYGYQKPEWIGDPEKEAAVLEDLRRAVRKVPRRKVRPQPAEKPSTVPLAPKLPPDAGHDEAGDTSSALASPNAARLADAPGTLQEDGPQSEGTAAGELEDLKSLSLHESRAQPVREDTSIFSIVPQDSALLMHFLDYTFPQQFPMYQARFPDGGRGWLLTLLLHTAPLYHAALALGAYHRLLTNFIMAPPTCRSAALEKQADHLEKCLRNVQKAMREMDRYVSGSRELEIGTAMSVVQLVFHESSSGQEDNWRIHLGGAVQMYRSATGDPATQDEITNLTRGFLRGGTKIDDSTAVYVQQADASHFVSGTILWLDIIASVTAGMKPKLSSAHSRDLAPDSPILLQRIMGCENSVMVQIGRIALLYAKQEEALRRGDASCIAIPGVVEEIRDEIATALRSNEMKILAATRSDDSVSHLFGLPEGSWAKTGIVTSVFAHAASIYLHLACHGFCDLELIRNSLQGAIVLLRTHVTNETLAALAFPLYIIGCATDEGEDRQLIRSIYSLPSFVNPLFKHRERVLGALEEIWRLRNTGSLLWSDTIGLTYDLLLI